MKAIEELGAWLDRTGTRQAAVAELIGTTGVRVTRLLAGKGTLPAAQLAALEKVTGIAELAVRLAGELPRGRRRKDAARVEPSAPPPPAAELSPDLPRRLAERLGEPEAEPLLAIMLRLATCSKSEGVRRQAAADLLDRLAGKALQRVLDTTPRPPAENAELLVLLGQIAGEAPADPLAAPPEEVARA